MFVSSLLDWMKYTLSKKVANSFAFLISIISSSNNGSYKMRLESNLSFTELSTGNGFLLKQLAVMLQNEPVDNKLLQALLMHFAFNLCKLLQDVDSRVESCVHFCLCSGFRWLKRNRCLLPSKA